MELLFFRLVVALALMKFLCNSRLKQLPLNMRIAVDCWVGRSLFQCVCCVYSMFWNVCDFIGHVCVEPWKVYISRRMQRAEQRVGHCVRCACLVWSWGIAVLDDLICVQDDKLHSVCAVSRHSPSVACELCPVCARVSVSFSLCVSVYIIQTAQDQNWILILMQRHFTSHLWMS